MSWEVKKENRSYSIITNFGCHFACPYCITKQVPVPETKPLQVLNIVKKLVKEDKIDFISISGGGDPFHKNDLNTFRFYKELRKIIGDIEFEVHTTYIKRIQDFTMFDRYVIHLQDINQIKNIIPNKNTRLVFVVQDHFTMDLAYKIRNLWDFELSFRQLIKENGIISTHLHEELKDSDLYYIEQNDYNNYIVNNKIYKKYSDIKEEL